MWESVGVILPAFGLIAIGFVAVRTRLVSERAGEGLSEFVYTLAVPCLIFRTLARAEVPAVQPWGYWIAYFAGVAVVWALAMLVAGRLFGLAPAERVLAGFSAGQSNTVLVGVPIILRAYGEEGAVPLFLLIAVHLPIMVAAASLLIEGRDASLIGIVRRLLVNPIIVAILLGSAARPLGAFIPEPAWRIAELIGSAAVPCALFAMGAALHRYGLTAGLPLPTIVSGLKLVLHPLIVYWLATRVFTMPPAWTGVAVLFAACPTGVNAYLLAERYRQGVALTSSAVSLSTMLAMGTIFVWLQVLGK
ncbi:AEC family transporter [Salinarimonas soli]|uniref:AEC family transporter n=1 Tax=Salinarimonas soli TaxID=1638099 RepID=A0A5B2V6S3_9HYPH|nr:AEC family transporter [Salinarimonas soli]KAA2234651.1 AEC family transporter [Salinarimonas soli]